MEYYRHINELPVANWFKMIETGNVGYLLKCSYYECEEKVKVLGTKEIDVLLQVFQEMPYQFDKVDTELIELEKKIWIMWMKWVATDNPQFKNQANILTAQKERMIGEVKDKSKQMTLTEQTAILNIQLKMSIDIFTCTTAMWFAYRNIFLEQNKHLTNDKIY